ncbi:hypothetical protein FWH09_00590 [Candidatus Saccharibacteria bacterium]|nr:hypothetical protein [Candidatus Saccharibacteria bacterium]
MDKSDSNPSSKSQRINWQLQILLFIIVVIAAIVAALIMHFTGALNLQG